MIPFSTSLQPAEILHEGVERSTCSLSACMMRSYDPEALTGPSRELPWGQGSGNLGILVDHEGCLSLGAELFCVFSHHGSFDQQRKKTACKGGPV